MPDRNRTEWPLEFAQPSDYARARRVLDGAGFTDRGVAEALGLESVREAAAMPMPHLLRLTGRGRPLGALIRLFLMGVAVSPNDASKALAPMALEAWIDAGLLEADGEVVRGAVQLLPLKDLRVAFDLPQKIRQGRSANYVMGVGSSTLTLANATIRRHSRRTLDLGTGCGLLAFLAAPHSRHVAAVDRNRRAVNMAAFNARLNGLENVEAREGDLFEPVSGERFDLVVSNPPFVVSPESHFIYRDSGMKGDEITRKIVRQVPGFLEEGGFCQVLCNWAHVAGQPWQQRLAAWFEGTGCDAWAMRSDTLDAPQYAAKWIKHTERDEDRQFDRRFDEWMAYYDRQRIEAVSGGLITLRRRSIGAAWFRADDGPPKMLGPAGEAIARAFGLRDFLASHGDESLPAQRLQISPEARLVQRAKPHAGGWAIEHSHLEMTRGLAYTGDADPYVAALIGRCDGTRPLADLIAELASATNEDPAKFTPACLRIVRRLIECGFLLPEGFADPG